MGKYPVHVTWAQGKKHQIHHASPEEVSKKNLYDNQFTAVTTNKNVQTITMKNVHTMQIHTAICCMHEKYRIV